LDIKLKKFNDRLSVRACAFILCIIFAVISLSSAYIGIKKINYVEGQLFGLTLRDITQTASYYDTESFKQWAYEMFNNMSVIAKYGNRDSIKEGKFIDNESFYVNLEYEYNVLLSEGINDKIKKYFDFYGDDINHPDAYVKPKPFSDMKDQFIKDFPDIVNETKADLISSPLSEFDSSVTHLDALEGAIGYIIESNGVTVRSDYNPDLTGVSVRLTDRYITTDEELNINLNEDSIVIHLPEGSGLYTDLYDSVDNNDMYFILNLDYEFVRDLDKSFDEAQQIFTKFSVIVILAFLGALIMLIYLIIVTGRRDDKGVLKLYRSDKLFSEIQLFIFVCLGGIFFLMLLLLEKYLITTDGHVGLSSPSALISLILCIGVQAICISLMLWFFLSIVRMLKAKIFLSRSLIVMAIKTMYLWIKTAFDKVNPMGKFVIIIVLCCLMSMTIVLAPVAIILLLGFGYKWIRKYNEVKKGVGEVSSGNLEYKIPVDENSSTEFDDLARQINTISNATKISIQNELRNQRMKTDLISNVSHDLKTPLTSIITYTDLLKKEGLKSKNADEYLCVIDEKSQRLKILTEDLFEAAKASSGSIPVRYEKVDIHSLIIQGLAELEEGLKEKDLDVIINAAKDKYYINADSQLLWRVVENLLNNVEKYALENSRVYIDLKEEQNNDQGNPRVSLEIKNMSKAPLNIPEDELIERFKRGDESRTSEGSGLGLSIAKDLTRLQGGWFEIKIDGDLFKATVVLDAYAE